jgi:hypothetical protein
MKTWWSTVASYPPTWVVAAVTIAAEWFSFSWFRPGLGGSALLVALGLIGLAGWPVVLGATGTVAKLQLARRAALENDRSQLIALAKELEALPDPRPARQLKAIQEKRRGLVDVLGKRLDAGEMTFARYLDSVEQVCSSVIANLGEVALALRSISALDEQYVDTRLAEIHAEASESAAAAREKTSLEDRRALQDAQEQKVADLLAQNEAAMTAIDRTTTALADAPIGRPVEDAEEAMTALEELAARASKYATG